MTKYVVDPSGARAAVRATEGHTDTATTDLSGLGSSIDSLATTLANVQTTGTAHTAVREMLSRCEANMRVAISRGDNAVGAGVDVIAALELADKNMAAHAYEAARKVTAEAQIFADKGISRR